MQDADTSACSPDAACSTSDLNEPDGCPSCSASGISIVSESLPGTGPVCLSLGMSVKLLPTPTAQDSVGARNSTANRQEGAVFSLGDTLTDAVWKTVGVPEWAKVNDDSLKSISSSEVSPASPSATPANVKLNLTIGGSGRKWQESFAHYDPDSSSWRTSQASLLPDSDLSSVIWPQRGTTRNGSAFELPMSALLTDASDCSSSLLPTPRTNDGTGAFPHSRPGSQDNLATRIDRLLPTPTTDDAKNTTRASGEFLSLVRTAHNLSLGEPTSLPSDDGSK